MSTGFPLAVFASIHSATQPSELELLRKNSCPRYSLWGELQTCHGQGQRPHSYLLADPLAQVSSLISTLSDTAWIGGRGGRGRMFLLLRLHRPLTSREDFPLQASRIVVVDGYLGCSFGHLKRQRMSTRTIAYVVTSPALALLPFLGSRFLLPQATPVLVGWETQVIILPSIP